MVNKPVEGWQSSVFNKDRANVMFVVDGVGKEFISGINKLKVMEHLGQENSITIEQYPGDSLSSLVTLFTGYSSAIHGITNSTWVNNGLKVEAFSSIDSVANVATIADLFTQKFEGKSMIYSMSSQLSAAKATNVNSYENKKLQENSDYFYYNSKTKTFNNKKGEVYTVDQLLSNLKKNEIIMRNKEDSIQIDIENKKVNVKLPKDNVDVQFDLENEVDLAFFLEITMINEIYKTIEMKEELVGDNVPDMITYTIKSIGNMENKKKQEGAMYIMDGVLATTIAKYQTLYGRIASQFVFLGNTQYTKIQNEMKQSEFKEQVYSSIKTFIPNKALFMNTFPAVYLESVRSDEVAIVCEKLENEGLKYYKDMEAVCLRVTNNGETVVHNSFALQDSATDASNIRDTAVFHVCIWFSIVLIFTAFAAVYAIFGMDTGSDAMLFRNPIAAKR